MVCCVLPSAEPARLFGAAAGSLAGVEAHHLKRYNEVEGFLQAVTKRIRTLEPSLITQAGRALQQIQCNKQQVAALAAAEQLRAHREAASAAGRCQPSLRRAFHLYGELDLEFLQECLAKETKSQASHGYCGTVQAEIDAHKRLVLVDWLVEVVDEFGLSQETLFLAVSLLDRFLSATAVPRRQLQLLGVTCLWVAAKYEEVLPPALQDFVDITDNSYAPRDLIGMEATLLGTLQYVLAVPTALQFLHQLLRHGDLDAAAGAASSSSSSSSSFSFFSSSGGDLSSDLGGFSISSGSYSSGGGSGCPSRAQLAALAEYLLELALLTPDTLRFRPSLVAAAALQLASNLLGGHAGGAEAEATHAMCAALSAAGGGAGGGAQLEACMEELRRMHRWAGSSLQPPCVRDKYNTARHGFVAGLWACGSAAA